MFSLKNIVLPRLFLFRSTFTASCCRATSQSPNLKCFHIIDDRKISRSRSPKETSLQRISTTHPSCSFHCSLQLEKDSEFQNMTTESFRSRSVMSPVKKLKSLNQRWQVLDLDEVVEFLREENAEDIVVIEVPEEMCYVDHFVVATALSGRHLASMAELINKLYKQRKKEDQPFTVVEGKRDSEEWQCVDMGNIVVHLMLEETREEYQLEKLWLLGPKHDDLTLEKPTDEEIRQRIAMQGLNLMSMDQDTVSALGGYAGVNPWELDEKDDDLFEQDDISKPKAVDTRSSNEDEVMGDDDAFLV